MIVKKNSFTSRLLACLLSFALVLSVAPVFVSPVLASFAVEEISPLAAGEVSFTAKAYGFDVRVALSNGSDDPLTGQFILAVYSDTDVLLDVYSEPFTAVVGGSANYTFSGINAAGIGDGYFKAFCWDSEYAPIAEAVTLDELDPDGKISAFDLVYDGVAADIYVDEDSDSKNYLGIYHAADNLKKDILAVSGVAPSLTNSDDDLSFFTIIAGSIGNSPVIDALIDDGKLDVSEIEGKWESYTIAYIDNPIPGVTQGLVIAGSDKRGTVFGIYKISETIGVSPWGFFADSVPTHQDELVLPSKTIVQGEPSVKYRGLFINDERSLLNWMEQYGPAHGHPEPLNRQAAPSISNTGLGFQSSARWLTSGFYVEFFDMILRQYGNYIWPAMWDNSFFTDDPLNGYLANAYGIVVGMSHQEFLNTPDKEWRWHGINASGNEQINAPWEWIPRNTTSTNKATWTYPNRSGMIAKWTKSMLETKDYETLPTLGLRNLDDASALTSSSVTVNVMLLDDVLAAQMQIIEDVGLDLDTQPLNVIIYKEVETFYYGGTSAADVSNPNLGWMASLDPRVTVVVCDDNHGNVRGLPMDINRDRPGGFGMYYHFDYNGSPFSYRWIDSTPLEKVREQMVMAYDYGVDRIWVTNVGDIKFNEQSIEYWFKLAYDVEEWRDVESPERAHEIFAKREFGEELADDISWLLSEYVQIAGLRKPEIIYSTTFSARRYDEANRELDRAVALKNKAVEIKSKIPPERMDAYYNFVFRPALIMWNVTNLMVNIEKNHLYATVGVTAANDFGQIARAGLAWDNFNMEYTYGAPNINDATYATTVNTIKTYLGDDILDATDTAFDYYSVANGKYYGYYPHRNKNAPYGLIMDDSVYYLALSEWRHRQISNQTPNGQRGGAPWTIGTGTAHNQVTTYNAAATSQMVVIPQVWDTATGTIPNAKDGGTVALPKFTSYGDETKWIEVAQTGNATFTYTAAANESWIVLSKNTGSISTGVNEKIDKLYVAIDWSLLPYGNTSGSITFTGNGNTSTVTVSVEKLDTSAMPNLTFIETDNYMSILSSNYVRSVPAVKDGVTYEWVTLPNYGRELSSVKVTPSNINSSGYAGAHTPGVNSPYLEYNIWVKTPGTVYVVTQWAPTNGVDPRNLTTMNYAAQIDDGAITTVNTMGSNYSAASGNASWTEGINNAVHTVTNRSAGTRNVTSHTGVTAGLHTLRIYMVHDGPTLQKILVGAGLTTNTTPSVATPTIFQSSSSNTNGTASNVSYFGPPQTGYVGKPQEVRAWMPVKP